MNDNEIIKVTNQIWDYLNSISNSKKTKEEQLKYIQFILTNLSQEQRKIGRGQIINHFKVEVENLEFNM